MRDSFRSFAVYLAVGVLLLLPAVLWAGDSAAATTAAPANTAAAAAATPTAATPSSPSLGAGTVTNSTLVDLLVKKGILSPAEAANLHNVSGSAGMEQLLLLLKAKGLVSDSEAAEVSTSAAEAESEHSMIDTESTPMNAQASLTTPGQAPQKKAEAKGPSIVPAIAPVRVLPIGPPTKNALGPIAWKLGSGVLIAPYGFIKSTANYQSSQPHGDDFPIPGFLNADTGPNPNPEFHLKARATRFGSKFEWPDASKNVTISGQIEADFEGNFSRVDNRNVSSYRSNALQLRLAFGRIDWTARPNTDIFFEAGQDWTIYGSSAMMNLLETTFFGAYWGNTYERAPQFRLGMVQKLGGSRDFKLSPEFAIMMPLEGDLPADSVTCTVTTLGVPTTCGYINGLGNQLGYGERQGADYAKPELESRVVLSFQLDKAPGVVPAEILWSGFYSGRQMTVLGSSVPTAYKSAFPDGADINSNSYGNQIAVSLPTRWATLIASGYMGADLRFMFAGQLMSYYNQTRGLTGIASALSVDGNAAFFGMNPAGVPVAAPQLPVRGYGGFVQLGLPISRWFNANPKGRNAGWQAYLQYGVDAANANDFRYAKDVGANSSAGSVKGVLKGGTLYYKMNDWIQFAFEEGNYSNYALSALTGANAGVCNATKVSGKPTCSVTNWDTEFGPIFTF